MGCIKEAIAVVVNNVNNKRSKFVDVNNQEAVDVPENNAVNAVNVVNAGNNVAGGNNVVLYLVVLAVFLVLH